MNSMDVLKAITRNGGPFSTRRWVCVPNVSWGWNLRYEADLIAIGKTGSCSEIEIKVSKQDLKADAEKDKFKKFGLDKRISKFYYAVPIEMKDFALQHIPSTAGLITVKPGKQSYNLPSATVERRAETIKTARKPTEEEILKLHQLGVLRYWNLLLKEQE
jgi:hypothetical protein